MKILYRDGDVAVVEKPAGMPSQSAASGMPDALSAVSCLCGCTAYPVHRLDSCTGGAMVFALNKKAAAYLSDRIRLRSDFVKEYLAVVCGCPLPTEGSMRDLLFYDRRINKAFVVDRVRKGVRDAELDYLTLETRTAETESLSLVRIRLHTGRTHQIRVQFAHRGIPLFGDRRYGGTAGKNPALWSCSLSFPRPSDGVEITVNSTPPEISPWSLFM